MVPKLYKPPSPKHTHTLSRLIEHRRPVPHRFDLHICVVGNLSAILGAEADGWLHSHHRAQQGCISQFPTAVAHIKSSKCVLDDFYKKLNVNLFGARQIFIV